MRNKSDQPISVVAPDPYRAVEVHPTDGSFCGRVRAVAWNNSRKTCVLLPRGEIVAHLDLDNYCDDLDTEVAVSVELELIDGSGMSTFQTVSGRAVIRILSFDEKIAKMKARPRRTNVPCKRFDVSDSTRFERVDSA
jgi:hypothetical protein